MKKRFIKFAAMLLVIAMLITDLYPLQNDGAWVEDAGNWIEDVFAADDEKPTYTFLMGNREVQDGETINYSDFESPDNTVWIQLKSSAGIVSGTAITWSVSNENIVTVKQQDNDSCSVQLQIMSPGYSGLSATLRTPDGITYTAVAYASIYVPLEWADDGYKADPTGNILASEANGNYGMFIAQNGELAANRTLQLHTGDSAEFPDANHYLRKLKYVTYEYTAESGKTGNVTSDVLPEHLKELATALSWETSDPTVVEVDAKTGVIKALSAGFARVTVTTDTLNDKEQERSSLSFNVLVIPEGYVNGYTTKYDDKFTVKVNPTDENIVIQTNAKYANALSWRIYRGDAATAKNEITDELAPNTEISEASGRVVLSNLSAGVYYVTAIAKKDKTASSVLATYDVTQTQIEYLGIVLIVPLNFPPDTLVMNYYNDNVCDSFDLMENSNLPAGTFRFSSDDPTVASVGTDDGVIEAEGLGKTQIKINKIDDEALKKIFGDYIVTSPSAIGYDGDTKVINVTVINGVGLSTTTQTLPLGSEFQLLLTAPNPYEGKIIWSSNNEKIVTVDESGKVKAVGVGDATVTVKIKVNGVTKRARCKFKVVSSVDSITLTSKEDFVEVGDNLTISAKISPELNNAELTWSCSDESIASIADVSPLSMTITGQQIGTVVITAINKENAIVGTKIIKVVQDIAEITLSDTQVTLPQSTGFYQLYATCKPAIPENQKLTWTSSDKKVVTVDENGKVTLVKPGTAVVTVITENGLFASCTFTVTQGVSSIALDETELTLYVGEGHRITYLINPTSASNTVLKWITSDSKVATVDATGYVTAKNVGNAVIMAQSTDGTGVTVMCKVTVLRTAKSVKLDVTTLTMNVGEVYQLETTLTPADATDSLTYESSNTKVATVGKKGKITAKSAGVSVVMVKTESGLSSYCTVTVIQQVTGIKLDSSDATIYVGDELQLEATIEPKSASDTDVVWTSSKTKVASVDKRGIVKGLSAGTTLVKCTSDDGEHMAYCVVTVLEKVTLVTVEEEVEVGVGKRRQLNAVVSGETATNKNVVWETSDPEICTVNQKGVITGVKLGKCLVIVMAIDGSEEYAICEVTVINATELIESEPSYVTLVQGETQRVSVTVEPSNATHTPVWSSADEKIAMVNKRGVITGVTPGETVVTASAPDNPDIKAITYVKVIAPVNATSVTFAESEVIMTAGETKTVPYSIVPSNFTESYTWSSDNPVVASVDEHTGRITANAVGAATITLMTKSGKKGSVRVFVVGLSRTYVELHQYESLLIKLEVDGRGSEKLTVRWDTDNQSIAEMQNGRIVAKALGTTTVYAVVNGRKLACTVKVIKNK